MVGEVAVPELLGNRQDPVLGDPGEPDDAVEIILPDPLLGALRAALPPERDRERQASVALSLLPERFGAVRARLDQRGDDPAGIDEDQGVAGVEEDALEGSGQKKTGSL